MEKITKRNIYEALIAYTETGSMSIPMETLANFAKNEIGILDRKAEKNRELSEKKRMGGDALESVVKTVLTNDYQTIADILMQIEGEDLTASKVSYRLNSLVRAGYAEKGEVSVTSESGSKRRAMAYRIKAEA